MAKNTSLDKQTHRVASIVIAASDSTALSKSNADYTCDGTADESEINTAIASLSSGGEVHLLEGTYNIASTINMASNIIDIKSKPEDEEYVKRHCAIINNGVLIKDKNKLKDSITKECEIIENIINSINDNSVLMYKKSNSETKDGVIARLADDRLKLIELINSLS